MQIATLDLPELQQFANKCAETLRGGEVIALIGDLGAGKTTFTKALLKAAGVRTRVTSPTFGIIAEHKTPKTTFYHVDLYRIKGATEFKTLGISENWQQPRTTYIIEWADKITRLLPKGTILIRLSPTKDNKRKIKISTK